MKKVLFYTFIAGVSISASAATSGIGSLVGRIADYDPKTVTVLGSHQMGRDNLVGMENFVSNSVSGGLYRTGCGVGLDYTGSSFLDPKVTVRGFHNGDFDLTFKSSLGTVTVDGIVARDLRPDGTAAAFAGKDVKITPCINLLKFVYIPVSTINDALTAAGQTVQLPEMPIVAYVSKSDEASAKYGIDNLGIHPVEIGDALADVIGAVPADVFTRIVKDLVIDNITTNETLKKLLGSVVDGMTDVDWTAAIRDAKLNCFNITTSDKGIDEGVASQSLNLDENFNGYVIHFTDRTGTITDRVATRTHLTLGDDAYYFSKEETDVTRTYNIAYVQDTEGNSLIFNFGNYGMFVHTDVADVANEDGGIVKRFVSSLHPATGTFDHTTNTFSLAQQQIGLEPILQSDMAGGYLSSVTVLKVWPVTKSLLSGVGVDWVRPAIGWADAKIGSITAMGVPVHKNTVENMWTTSGGHTTTVECSAEIDFSDYCARRYLKTNIAEIPHMQSAREVVYSTVLDIDLGEDAAEVTHRYDFEIDEMVAPTPEAFDNGNRQFHVCGTVTPRENSQFVESYEIYVVPKDVTSCNKTNEIKPAAENGIDYRYHSTLSNSDWINAVKIATIEPVSAYATAAGIPFDAEVAYSAIPVKTHKTFGGWVDKADKDKINEVYTFFVKTNYVDRDEQGRTLNLAPTFGVLAAPKSNVTTGIDAIEAETGGGDAVYYTLQGVRVAVPEAGNIYIVTRGDKVSKELYR